MRIARRGFTIFYIFQSNQWGLKGSRGFLIIPRIKLISEVHLGAVGLANIASWNSNYRLKNRGTAYTISLVYSRSTNNIILLYVLVLLIFLLLHLHFYFHEKSASYNIVTLSCFEKFSFSHKSRNNFTRTRIYKLLYRI